ncbi:hypothetical protein CC85DRAFT_68058 [Cutaneotrichosporon oleaginosum]|uniref:diphosphoinositol-polyphosphate diphosphatase n=1 Tax=Cutaneotrichosporon oleaginosum TaxID=879819 RepID=A0A0J0XPW6_9TREE|nr:uncharacterized protein CC85DRAFT_68058 [Cutaneotrichosporon oleaginosum]KLT43117.1 hypothetical protein CC85DRAFT_68058 [Cutaneotrichosporon oleaginosum]TXT10045.1 hypothetical protein COLE_03979 [Cutaneotrichosporon oleaginosum]
MLVRPSAASLSISLSPSLQLAILALLVVAARSGVYKQPRSILALWHLALIKPPTTRLCSHDLIAMDYDPPPCGEPIPPFLAKIRASARAPISVPLAATDGGSSTNTLYIPPPPPAVEEDVVPPENFSAVTHGVYRSGFPKKRNFKFLETLQLKTVLTLVLEDYPEANLQWCQDQDIQFMQFGIPGNKEPFDNIPEDVICSALVAILDRRNHPLLIHCNKGKHRTGCLIGCIRRLQSWSMTSIFDEYRRFSAPKSRAVDQQFIDLFDLAPVWEEVMSPMGGGLANLPAWRMLALPMRLATKRSAMEREKGERDERERRRREAVAVTGPVAMIDAPPVVDIGMEVVAR